MNDNEPAEQRSDEFRRRAAEARARAEAATDLQLKDSWRACADSWWFMAEQAERMKPLV
jgi:hypothetical protein